MKPSGRPRTTACVDIHVQGETCKTCARERANRFRRRHRTKVSRYDAERARVPDRQLTVRARATLHRAIARQALTPPLRCANCAEAIEALRPIQPDPRQPKTVVWVCKRCRNGLRALGGEVYSSWVWPGPQPPRRTRHQPRFDEAIHRDALAQALAAPRGTQQENAYASAYLSAAADASAWFAWGARAGDAWSPTPHPVVDELWRRYMRRSWQRQREKAESEGFEGGTIVPIAAVPFRPHARANGAIAPSHPRTVAPIDLALPPLTESEQIAKLEAAEAAFVARMEAILVRTGLSRIEALAADADEDD
jgi:hypothetical protein